MEQRGDLLIFPYPGGQITFHQDLKVYFSVRNMIYHCSSTLLSALSANSEPQKNLDRLTQNLISFTRRTILPSLHERKIYNVVEDDFIMGNPAYVEMFSSTQNFQRGEENAISESAYEIQAKKDLAYNEAQSTITGLGYTLYSSSIVDHAIYASKSEEAIKKQAWKAQEHYNKAAKEIEASGKQRLDNAISAGRQSYRSGLEKKIPALLEHMVSVYCKKLAANGQFNSSCLVGIDEARSNAILENLQIAGAEKEGLIYSAIQLCPYNVNAFQAAYDTMDITVVPCFKEILGCFRMTENFCAWLKTNRQETNADVQVFYRRSKKLISIISFLKDVPEINVAHDLLSDKLDADLSIYFEFSKRIKIQKGIPTKNYVEKVYGISVDREPEKCSDVLAACLQKQHLSGEWLDYYERMGIDVFGMLSKSFGKEIKSFQDADDLIIAAWKKEVEDISNSQKIQEWRRERDELQMGLTKKDYPKHISQLLISFLVVLGFDCFLATDHGFAPIAFFMGICVVIIYLLIIVLLLKEKRKHEQKIEELNKLLGNKNNKR